MDFSQFSAAEQNALEQVVNKKQMRDMLSLYSGLVERCFTACSNDMTTKALTSKESQCITTCASKFLAFSSRVGLRFSETNADADAAADRMANGQEPSG